MIYTFGDEQIYTLMVDLDVEILPAKYGKGESLEGKLMGAMITTWCRHGKKNVINNV